MHRHTWLTSLGNNLIWGLREGLEYAFLYSTGATLLFLLSGATITALRFGVRAPLVFGLYAIGPVLAGGVVGLFRPLTPYLLGKIFVTFVVCLVLVPIGTLMLIPHPKPTFWRFCLELALIVSPFFGLVSHLALGPSRKSSKSSRRSSE